jgi:hypothetical protein
MNNRPTHKELSKKLKKATELLSGGRVDILEPDVILADSFKLGYSFKIEFNTIVGEILNQATPKNYAGARPPQNSYETKIQGAELFAFVVSLPDLDNRSVYFKFSLYQDVLIVVSLHEDRAQEG